MNTPSIQQLTKLREATKRHAEMDMLVRGVYALKHAEGFRGCSVGCLAYDIDPEARPHEYHRIVSDYYGYPEWLVHLQDGLFENADMDMHVMLADAIKPRENWRSVMHTIHWRTLSEITLPIAGTSKVVVRQLMELHKAESNNSLAWSTAESAAMIAAMSSGISAARFTAWSAADSAAEHAANYAAEAAASSTASSTAKHTAWKKIMSIVLEEVSK